MGKIIVFLLIVSLFTFIVYNVYYKFIEPHLFDDEVEEIIEDAAHDRIIKEAKKTADKIKNDDIEEEPDAS